jgi:hypothetical protein
MYVQYTPTSIAQLCRKSPLKETVTIRELFALSAGNRFSPSEINERNVETMRGSHTGLISS